MKYTHIEHVGDWSVTNSVEIDGPVTCKQWEYITAWIGNMCKDIDDLVSGDKLCE